MKVKELIEILQTLPREAEIYYLDSEWDFVKLESVLLEKAKGREDEVVLK